MTDKELIRLINDLMKDFDWPLWAPVPAGPAFKRRPARPRASGRSRARIRPKFGSARRL